NYDQAAASLEPAVKKYEKFAPINDDLRFDYANALMSRRNPDWKTAGQALGKINGEVFGQFAEVLAQRATCYHKLKDYNTSLTLANDYLAKFKDHGMAGDTRFLRAENMFLLNQLAPAIKAYQEFQVVNKDHPNTLAAAFRVAQIYHHQEQWDQSLAAARPLLAKKPEGPLFAQLAFLVGNCHFRKEQWKECLEPLEAFVATRVQKKGKNNQQVTADPNVDTALIQLAVAYDRTEDSIKALEHLETLTRFYPTPTPHLPLALAEQGRLAYESGDLKLARAALERFLSEAKLNKEPFKSGASPQRLRVNYFLGWVNATEKKHEPAALHFGVVSKDPKHALAADAALQQGLAYVHLEEFAQAAVLFPEILKRYPQHEKLQRVTYYAGLSLARQEKWGPAAGHLSKVADTWPDSKFADQALYEWAWCERKQKREAEAVKLYERFLGKYKQSSLVVKVQSELAGLNLKSGAQDMVIERLTKALSEIKDDALKEELRYQLASAHYSKGEHEKSAGMFEQLLSDYPKSKLKASMCFQAGESRYKLKETVTARGHFAEGMKVGGIQPAIAESMMMRLAEMQSATADHTGARKTYQDFIGRFPESKWRRNAQFGLAWSLENSDKPTEAIHHYAPLLDPKAPIDLWTVRARFQTGECYFNMQKYEQAVKEFLNVEIHYKKHPAWQAKGILEIGRVLLAQNKREDAKQRFKDVIIRYPKEKAAIVARQYLDQLRTNG
ncbi:MAG: tetratricopeptide repeat protein, partial [Planctomycetota bacterium]